MRRRVLALLVAMSMASAMAACGSGAATETASKAEEQVESAAGEAAESVESAAEEAADSVAEEAASVAEEAASVAEEAVSAAEEVAAPAEGEVPEVTTINWARGNSGHALVTIGKKLGYFDEYGIVINEIPMDTGSGTALTAGQVDICSKNGTNVPLSAISAGDDIVIFGGHMLTGAMSIIAKTGTGWEGVESFIGKKVACPPNYFALTGKLIEAGHTMDEVEWLSLGHGADAVAAVLSGEATYAVVGTGMNYQIDTNPDLERECFVSDITPNYSCCRMYTRRDFIENNPITCKLLLKALIRAEVYFNDHRAEVTDWLAEELDQERDYVAAYNEDEHYRINVDPIRNRVIEAWNILAETGMLEEGYEKINIDDHINIDLYRQALEELMADETIYNENKEAYDEKWAFFEEQNL